MISPIRIGLIIFCLPLIGFSQKETNNWLFSDSVWLNFNSSPVSSHTTKNVFAFESCSSISDSTGNLLFYTNGKNVYDKNGQIMPNGYNIFGPLTFEITQGVLILPFPRKKNLFYIFALNNSEIIYTIIDLSLNGGLGEVMIPPSLLYKSDIFISEKLTVVKHCNNKDFWLVSTEVRDYGDSSEIDPYHYQGARFKDINFLSFYISEYGVSSFPIRSKITETTNSCESNYPFMSGQLKISPNGKFCAFGHGKDLYIFSANSGRGTFDYLDTYMYETNFQVPGFCDFVNYGLEFFSDSKALMFNNMFVDIINKSTQKIGNYIYSQQQLGIDKRIYFCNNTKNANQAGVSTKTKLSFYDYNNGSPVLFVDSIDLNNANTSLGLPNFPSFYFDRKIADFSFKGSCEKTTFTFTPIFNDSISTLQWFFSDDSTTSFLYNPTHQYLSSGEYEVKLIVSKNSLFDTITHCVNVLRNSEIAISKIDTFYCYGSSIDIGKSYPVYGRCVWNTGDTLSGIKVSKPGIYNLNVANQCQNNSYEFNVVERFCEPPQLRIPNIFTPNNDNVNEKFLVKSKFYKSLKFYLYNRWGIEIISSEHNMPSVLNKEKNIELWDGNLIDGKKADEGIYFYIIQGLDVENRNATFKGWVHLAR